MIGDAKRCPSKELIFGGWTSLMISQPVELAADCAEKSMLPGMKGCWLRVGDGVLLY